MMKIAIDSSALAINRFSGLAQVVQNLIQNIRRVDTASQLNLFINYFKTRASAAELCFPGTVNHVLRFPRRLVDCWWRFGWPPFESYLKDMDVFHSLHISVPPTKKMKTILTVHDCRYLSYPDLYNHNEVATYRHQMETALKRVDIVCAVSEFTRQELLSYYNFPSERIKVIYNGFSPLQDNSKNFEKIAEKFIKENNLPQSYLIYIGTPDPRKNLNRLIEAMFQCREEFNDFPHLLIAGINFQDWLKSDIKIRTDELGFSKYVHLCGVLEKDLLIGLTQKALILCYPSFYEGFGFPPLEAMSLGVPVLAGNSASIPEVTGDAACLVDPWSVGDIAQGMRKIIFDSEYRKTLVVRGLHQIKKFSWPQAAADYISLYKEAMVI